jgi:Transposase
MVESMTVTVGLDVHASSVRIAAIRGDRLLEERTLPYDEVAVERALRRWPAVRCCYEAGPTGFGLYRHLSERGIDCEVVAPGLVPQRPGDRVKTDRRDARKLARLLAGGLLEPIYVPSPELEAARDLVRAREGARLDRMRDRHPPAGRVCLARTPAPDRRLRARAPPARPGRSHPRARLALPAAAASPLAEDGRPRQALAKDRRRVRPRTRRLRLGDRDRATADKRLRQARSSSGCA